MPTQLPHHHCMESATSLTDDFITDVGFTLWISLPCIPGVRMLMCYGVCKSAGSGMWVGASVSDESEDR